MNPLLQIENASVGFNRSKTTYSPLVDFSFMMRHGETVAIVGDSGSGKSTLLHFIAGLLDSPNAIRQSLGGRSGLVACEYMKGDVKIDGDSVMLQSPQSRPVGIMLQQYGVYDHLSVRSNLCLPLRLRGAKRSDEEDQIRQIARLLGIEKYLDATVASLSGGEAQRVALGKLLLKRPKVALLDEAFAHVDPLIEKQLTTHLRGLLNSEEVTSLKGLMFVTHDLTQVVAADHIILFRRLEKSLQSIVRVFSKIDNIPAIEMMKQSKVPEIQDWCDLVRPIQA